MSSAKEPRISVVMSVFNDAARVSHAIEGILTQSFRDTELIVVNDGSTDRSGELLDAIAATDARLRVIHQQNGGLTRAIMRGCAEARGEFIARQDSDDWSHPFRIGEQLALIARDERIGFVSCATQFVGPKDEPLDVLRRSEDPVKATQGLLNHREGPPAHGSVMFRRSLYLDVGGYRPQFFYSQDSDLWLRMAEKSWIGYVPEVRYVHRRDVASTSSARRPLQRRFGELGHLCRQARLVKGDEAYFLAEAAALSDSIRRNGGMDDRTRRRAHAEAAYLLGSQLASNRDSRARHYLQRAIRENPKHLRAWARLAQSWLTGRALPAFDFGTAP